MRLSFFLFSLLFAALHAKAQQPAAVADALKLTDSLYLPEKLHLHFDRSQYAPGETIWFKAYLMQAGMPATISRTLYVNVSDEQGKVMVHHTSPIIQGTSSGSYALPMSFAGRRLLVTAYTTWMLNEDSAFLFRQWITITQNGNPPASAAANATRMYLLPEGGQLVEGLSSKVAFLAHDASGKPVAVSGVVKDKAGKIVADSVRSQFNGMGSFGLRPQPGNSYSFVGKDESGKPLNLALPAALPQGIVLSVSGTQEHRQFVLHRSESLAPAGKYQVLATLNGTPVYKANADLSVRTSTSGQIPVASLPSGVLTITVFDAALQPMAERISFVNNDNFSIDAQLATVDINPKARGRNVLEMLYYDSLPATYSIAVTDADLPAPGQHTIASRLLLSSELQGRVWNPAWYFNTFTEEAKDMLDLVMLTHGWRKIDWATARTGRAPQLKYFPDTAYLRLTGTLNGGNSADYRAAREMTAIVQSADSSRQFIVLPVGPNGQIRLEEPILFDTTRIYYMFGKNQLLTQKLNLQMSNGLLPAPGSLRYVDLLRSLPDTAGRRRVQFFANEQEKLRRLMETTTLEGVTVQSKKKSNTQVLDEKYASGLFAGGDAYNFDVANDPRAVGAITVLQYLQGQVAGLQISGGAIGGDASVTWRGGTPDFFMDQMPVDAQMLSTIPMTDVAYIKVFRPPFFGAMGGGAGGGIAVYTKRGGDRSPETDRAPGGMNKAIAVGYTAQRTFFSPDYSKDAPLGSDVRPTIYWNPYVVADGKQRKTRISFYNNDVSRRLRIVVEGMNANGQLLRVEKVVP